MEGVAGDVVEAVLEGDGALGDGGAHRADVVFGDGAERGFEVGRVLGGPVGVEEEARLFSEGPPVEGPEEVLLGREEDGDAARRGAQ